MYKLFDGVHNSNAPRIIAHRGASSLEPENSVPAFEAAGRLGAWAIETDVYKTQDGALVCFHNKRVDGMTDGEGEIAGMSFCELSRLKITSGNNVSAHSGDALRIPTFDEYLTICKRYGSAAFIELKMPIADEVLAAVARHGMQEQCVFSSSNISHLEAVRRFSDRVFIHLIFGSEDNFSRLTELGYAGLSFKIANLDDVPAGLVEKTHKAGLRVCFRAADTPELIIRAIDMGCDYVPSNRVMTLRDT